MRLLVYINNRNLTVNKMTFKLLDSVIATSMFTSCRSRRFLTKSRFTCGFLNHRGFCSKKDSDDSNDSNDSDGESKIKDLLRSSSPLKSSSVDKFWATSPYPTGTVFREDEIVEKESDSDGRSQSILLFPGQGNQFVGMAKNLMNYPVALDIFKTANDILGYDLLKMCLEGPEKSLNDTLHCQPATFVCSLALLEKVKEESPWVISNCVATCGYSLGELTALVFSGCINFEQGLNLVKLRAEVMEECCKKTPGGMLTVFVGPGTELSKACSDAIEHCKSTGIEEPVCGVASYLFPNCKVIAGNMEGLEFLIKNGKKYGIKRQALLPVSGAFHTSLMKEAAEPFKEKLSKIELKRPLVHVYSNVTSKRYLSTGHLMNLLPKQIYQPVKWHQTMNNIFSRHSRYSNLYFYECGPGSSLTAIMKKINHKTSNYSFAIRL